MARIIVFVSGGVIQDWIADCDSVELMIVNDDEDRCCGRLDRQFLRLPEAPELFRKTVAEHGETIEADL